MSAIFLIRSIWHGPPSRWTGMIARVLSVIAFSISSGSMLKVLGSTSTSTGVHPTSEIGYTVVAQVTAGVMISLPFGTGSFRMGLVRTDRASRFAELPELTITACFDPLYWA